jgi:signal transduction histidine kinase
VYGTLRETNWKPRTSVRLRFALIQGFFVTVIISLLFATLYLTVRPRLDEITNNSYRILVNNLVASIYPSFEAGKAEDVRNAAQRVEGQQGVKYVLLVDKDNVVYYDSFGGESTLRGKNYKDEITDQVLSSRDTVVGKVQRVDTAGVNQTYYNYAAAFFTNNNPVLTVRLGVDQEFVEGQFNQLARLFMYLGIAGVLFGIIASFMLTARLTKPIIKLTESALAIRAGNLNAYPNITTNDELEQLSREFQGMVEKLKQFYFQEFKQKNDALVAKKHVEEINQRLKDLDHQKTDFLNTASHQLRTPLSVIHWSLSLIVEDSKTMKLSKDKKELLDEALKSTKRMVDLVNDLLDISRIEQGRKELNWELANYAKVAKDVVAALQPLAVNKNLKLDITEDSIVPDSYLDPKSFYEVINNFVDNAIKYTKEGFVAVRTGIADKEITITISDSGIGMDDDEKSRLFTRFARGSEASKMFANGSGLGMFVAQSILKQHGGSITVESEKGKGTAFTLHLPLYTQMPRQMPGPLLDEDEHRQVGGTTQHS